MDLLDIGPVIARCRALLDDGTDARAALSSALDDARFSDETVSALRRADPTRPYGRRVLFADDAFEVMLASWTPGSPCAPHDHGGSEGSVRVVRGVALHRVWRVTGGRLHLVAEERVPEGQVLVCGPDLVHSMADGGGAEPLVTLHLYAGPIDFMVVYDLAAQETLVVEGTCGAWVPEPHLIRRRIPGFTPPAEI